MNDIENWIMFHHFTSITSATPPPHPTHWVRSGNFSPTPLPILPQKGGRRPYPTKDGQIFLWFFQLLNCTVANAQLKTKQLVLHDWSYWFQTVPTSHRRFCYVAKLRPSHEFLSTKNSCPTLTTGRRCVSSKNYGKIRIKKKRAKWYSNQVWLHGHSNQKNAFVKLGHFRESNVYDFRNHDAEDHETKYPPWKSNRHFYRVAGEHAVLHHQFLNRIVIRGIVKQEHI